jgi:hypothetical protein
LNPIHCEISSLFCRMTTPESWSNKPETIMGSNWRDSIEWARNSDRTKSASRKENRQKLRVERSKLWSVIFHRSRNG